MRHLAAQLAADVADTTAPIGGQRAVHDAIAIIGERADHLELLGAVSDLTDELLDRIFIQGGHEAALACPEYRYAVEARMPGWSPT